MTPDFRPTGKTIHKGKIILHVDLEVIKYTTPEYRNVKTVQRVHADFPEGFVDDINYDGSVKTFAYLLGNECNVSHDKIREFLSELTNGELQISKGMINRLTREFSRKIESERKEIYVGLMGHPVETYQGILVHDHEYPNLSRNPNLSSQISFNYRKRLKRVRLYLSLDIYGHGLYSMRLFHLHKNACKFFWSVS